MDLSATVSKQAQPSLHPSLREARERLAQIKGDILVQIRNYPPPIPACDAQFNHLLERRDAITEELARFDRWAATLPPGAEPAAGLLEFSAASPFLGAGKA